MRYGKWFISLFTALFILVAVIFGENEYSWDGTIGISAQVTAQGQTEEILCWGEDRDDFYLFLPGYAALSQVQLRTNVTNEVYLDGRRMTEGMTCEGFEMGVEYDLCYMSKGKEHHYSLTFLQSANVPTLYIDTASGSLDHIHEVKGNEEPGTLRLYTTEGDLNHSGNLESIKGRGNSTWDCEKKPYNLTLSTDADLLGMGGAKRWILLANAMDPSNLKNKIAYDLARDAGLAYTPECAWVDLYANGEYVGLYLLSERNEVHEQRVNISPGGSFLVSKDWEWRMRSNGDPYIMTEDKTALRIHYSDMSEEDLLAIIQRAENAILSRDGIDSVSGKHWQELIDLDSWVKRYLLEEILGNTDASTLSQFFYYDGMDQSGKIYAGPVWDMDLILRYPSDRWKEGLDRFFGNVPHVYGSHWMSTLYDDDIFYNRVKELYEAVYQPLLENLLSEGIHAYYSQMQQAAKLNNLRWEMEDAGDAKDVLWEYLNERVEFLNRIWVEEEAYVIVTVIDYESERTSFAIGQGTCVPRLPEYVSDDSTVFYGWYYLMTEKPFDITQSVYEDIVIDIRYETVQQVEDSGEKPAEEE